MQSNLFSTGNAEGKELKTLSKSNSFILMTFGKKINILAKIKTYKHIQTNQALWHNLSKISLTQISAWPKVTLNKNNLTSLDKERLKR